VLCRQSDAHGDGACRLRGVTRDHNHLDAGAVRPGDRLGDLGARWVENGGDSKQIELLLDGIHVHFEFVG
jgi:hypothetical protein